MNRSQREMDNSIIGSRLMNERKKEKRVLAVEEDHINHLANPDMVALMEGKAA